MLENKTQIPQLLETDVIASCGSLKITCEDNMALMKRYPDNYFDLAIVDPPYGMEGNKYCTVNKKFVPVGYAVAEIDRDGVTGFSLGNRPTKEYFNELFRVSKNYIIWGGQYFSGLIPPNPCVIVWDKKMGKGVRFSDGEIAFTSFKTRVDFFRYNTIHCNNKFGGRIHPTEKPVDLYKYILENYAKEGYKILDTHLGSGSIAIACHDYGFDLTACELDCEYYDKAMKRINNHVAQQKLF